ncbi:MAG: hypothetical protein ACOC93_05540, partial [Planctomycetota bacterium]
MTPFAPVISSESLPRLGRLLALNPIERWQSASRGIQHPQGTTNWWWLAAAGVVVLGGLLLWL